VDVSADPVDFEEAVEQFADRAPILKSDWIALSRAAQEKAFTAAGVAQLSIVAEVKSKLLAAIKAGTPFEDFKRQVASSLALAWLRPDGVAGKPAEDRDAHGRRIELIFRNASNTSFNAGRFKQAKHPDTKKLRPYWMFDGIGDARQSSVCKACDGTILPAEDPWWANHLPPLHHNCRSGFVTLTEKQAKREDRFGEPAPKTPADDGFGREPSAPPWKPKASDYPPELAKVSKKAIAAAIKATPPPKPPKALSTKVPRFAIVKANGDRWGGTFKTEAAANKALEKEIAASERRNKADPTPDRQGWLDVLRGMTVQPKVLDPA
jgi:SPP1 gp7 family putative phage head morphogenesis protein